MDGACTGRGDHEHTRMQTLVRYCTACTVTDDQQATNAVRNTSHLANKYEQ